MSGQEGKKGKTHNILLYSLELAINAFQAGPKVEFESDLRWKEVERMFDVLEMLIEEETGIDSSDVVADLDWFDPVLCEEKANRFMKWLQIDNDPETRTISMVVNKSKSRYELWLNPIHATATTPNEILFSVPAGTFMTGGDAAKKFGLSETNENADVDEDDFADDDLLMALFLLFEKYVSGDESTWKPFIDVLPSMRYYNSTFSFLTREKLDFFRKSSPSLYCAALNLLMNVWLDYCVIRKLLMILPDEEQVKALGKMLTYKRYLWATSVVEINTFNNMARLGLDDEEVTGITVRHIPYNNDSTQKPIFLHTSVSGPYLQFGFGLIPFMDMCDRDVPKKLDGWYYNDLIIQLGPTLGDSETRLPIMKTGVCSSNYLILYDLDVANSELNEQTYNLNLNLVKNTALFQRRQAALHALGLTGLTTQETFQLTPKLFLNRTVRTDEEMLIYKMLFTFVHIYMAENELLQRIERSTEGEDLEFLTVPSKEAWACLAEQFDNLHKLAGESLERMNNLWGNREMSPTNTEKICLQYMEKERNSLARFTEIVTNRRDNDPKDELPSSLNPDEDLQAELSEDTKALILSLKEHYYGPDSLQPLPTPGTQDDPTSNQTNPSA